MTAKAVPDYESTITARLAHAGAVLVGKLNLLEFAMGSGVVSGFGPAGEIRGIWRIQPRGLVERVRCGARRAHGAAVDRHRHRWLDSRAGHVLRHCRLKQTYGRVSRHGVTTLAWTLDHAGPMTRTVADAALMLQIIAGADGKDRT